MSGFELIKREEIDGALIGIHRQYLVGLLNQPQALPEIEDGRIEVGISRYAAAANEEPYFHTRATEYHYIISGMTEYLDLDTGQVHLFRAGDFYAIKPGTKYAQRVKQQTAILFIKTPAGNDKQEIEASPQVREWLDMPLRAKRIDHVDNQKVKANSLRPAIAVAAFDEQNRLLMERRRDSGKWTMPGGTFEFGENISGCARREFNEETGLDIVIESIIGTYSNPGHLIEYSDGEVRQEFTLLLCGKVLGNSVVLDDESTEFTWALPRDALNLDMAESQRVRVEDVVSFCEKGEKVLR